MGAPDHRLRRRLSAVFFVVGILGIAAPANAHPFGQKPVLIVARAGTSVGVQWIIAPDDFDALTQHLALGPVTPPAAGDHPRFHRYVLARLHVEQEGRACTGRVAGVGTDPTGFVTDVLYACPQPVERVSMSASLLLDLSADYITLVRAGTGTGIVRDVLTASSATMEIDFAAGAVVAPSASPAPASKTERILASIRRGSGLPAALGLAFVLGLVHGLTPGHGKTIAAAYLVGAGGTMRHSLALAGVVASTHGASTALLAAIPLALGQQQPPAALSGWLEVGAGVLILGLGAALFRRPHAHAHAGAIGPLPLRRLAGIGFAGGLVPNPEALLVVLAAFSLDRWTAGIAMIGAFSAGLGVVVLGIAVTAVRGRALIARRERLVSLAPRLAASLFLVMGAVVTIRGVVNV